MEKINLTTTTFHYETEKFFKFKSIVALKKSSLRNVISSILDHYLEDHEDMFQSIKIMEMITNMDEKKIIEWDEFKRRMNLDEL